MSIIYIDLNSTTPAAPAGAHNVHFRQEDGHAGTKDDPIPTSAYLDRELPAGGDADQVLAKATADDYDVAWVDAGGGGALGVVGITIDGGAATPATGSKGYLQIPFAATIKSWTMLADASGSAQITVKKCSYADFPTTASIVAAAPPALSGVQKATNSTLTGWTTAITAGDILEFVLDSISTIKRLQLFLEVEK